MKEVYRVSYLYEVNNLWSRDYGGWHYGEVPANEVHDVTLEQLKNLVCGFCCEKRLFSKKYRIKPISCDKWIKEEDFQFAHKVIEYEPVKWKYTLSNLAEKLPADEFVDWLKDAGITGWRVVNGKIID